MIVCVQVRPNFLIADRGGQLLRMYINRIPVKLDRNAFWPATEVVFRPVEKAEHQGCCGWIPPDSRQNRNPVQGSSTSTNRNKNRNVQPSCRRLLPLSAVVVGHHCHCRRPLLLSVVVVGCCRHHCWLLRHRVRLLPSSS